MESFLDKCLESLSNQTMKDFEILVIDDGSTDKTLDVARRYYTAFDNYKIFEQENKGVSSARNFGIQHATGDYLFFMDADDTVNRRALELISNNLKNFKSETIMIDYKVLGEDGKSIPKRKLRFVEQEFPEYSIKGEDALLLLFQMKISHWPWEIITKKSTYQKNKIFFPEGQRYGEDLRTSFKILFFSSSVSFINQEIYNYTN